VSNGIQLKFAGVPYSAANVEAPGASGFTAQYKYWGYEHLFYRSTFGGNGLTVAKQLASDLTTTTASVSGILLSAMHVSRDTDGGAIVLLFQPGLHADSGTSQCLNSSTGIFIPAYPQHCLRIATVTAQLARLQIRFDENVGNLFGANTG
jgi:hypothetical protein